MWQNRKFLLARQEVKSERVERERVERKIDGVEKKYKK
jgi:hypothetical protein